MYQLVNFSNITDSRGSLTYLNETPFPVKRMFFIEKVPMGERRGEHAHKKLRELLIPLYGSFQITLQDELNTINLNMFNPQVGIIVEPHAWRVLSHFSRGALCLSLCSHEFNESDYLKTWQEFIDYYK